MVSSQHRGQQHSTDSVTSFDPRKGHHRRAGILLRWLRYEYYLLMSWLLCKERSDLSGAGALYILYLGISVALCVYPVVRNPAQIR